MKISLIYPKSLHLFLLKVWLVVVNKKKFNITYGNYFFFFKFFLNIEK